MTMAYETDYRFFDNNALEPLNFSSLSSKYRIYQFYTKKRKTLKNQINADKSLKLK